jgi:GH18 family chitinase
LGISRVSSFSCSNSDHEKSHDSNTPYSGNGEDYKTVPNSSKAWEIDAYPLLLQSIRAAIGPNKLISAAVPGLPRDMLAFTSSTIPIISSSVDFLNIMTYDLMNRRDSVTKHHTGIAASLASISAYADAGFPPSKMNLGFAFYLKWFYTSSSAEDRAGCKRNPVGCKTPLMEDPDTGADLAQGGGFSWHDGVPGDLKESFERAMQEGTYDEVGGGHYYWDEAENRWWTWDTPEVIVKKFPEVVEKRGMGGVFAWGLGEDAEEWVHLKALTDGFVETFGGRRGELF